MKGECLGLLQHALFLKVFGIALGMPVFAIHVTGFPEIKVFLLDGLIAQGATHHHNLLSPPFTFGRKGLTQMQVHGVYHIRWRKVKKKK
jgi:hypothetical protein